MDPSSSSSSSSSSSTSTATIHSSDLLEDTTNMGGGDLGILYSPNKRLKLSEYNETRDIFLNQHLNHIQSANDFIKSKQYSNHPQLSNSIIPSKSIITLPNPNLNQQQNLQSQLLLNNNNNNNNINGNGNKKKKSKLKKSLKRVLIQFRTRNGESTGNPIDIPIGITVEKLELLVNTLLNQTDEPLSYAFYYQPLQDKNEQQSSSLLENEIDEIEKKEKENEKKNMNTNMYINTEITTSIRKLLEMSPEISTEKVLSIIYEPQAMFKVQPIARCSAELPGHTEAILSVKVRNDNRQVATGSGDTSIRLWDVLSQSPERVLQKHKHWVLVVEYSPCGQVLASGDMQGIIWLWDTHKGTTYQEMSEGIQAHTKWITSIAWEPFHLYRMGTDLRFASAGKDTTIKIYNVRTRCVQFSLSGHKDAVTMIKWGGEGYLYSCSRDKTIRVWDPNLGTCIRILDKHAHWVNHIALSTEYALKCGPWDPSLIMTGAMDDTDDDEDDENDNIGNGENNHNQNNTSSSTTTNSITTKRTIYSKYTPKKIEQAKKFYEKVKDCRGEILVSASDDFTLFLWNPLVTEKPVARMTGHHQLVNHVCFSPNGRLIASASFDKSVRIWDGLTGKFFCKLFGHVQSVYRVCWSADSRMIASASKDSTVKIWNLKLKKLMMDLPGHSDEVFDCDWSTQGTCLASGGKDRVLRIWRP